MITFWPALAAAASNARSAAEEYAARNQQRVLNNLLDQLANAAIRAAQAPSLEEAQEHLATVDRLRAEADRIMEHATRQNRS